MKQFNRKIINKDNNKIKFNILLLPTKIIKYNNQDFNFQIKKFQMNIFYHILIEIIEIQLKKCFKIYPLKKLLILMFY